MISVTRHNPGTNHRNRKWKTLSLKDMRWSEFPWHGNFRDKSQKCSGPGISDFPKLSVTALPEGPRIEKIHSRSNAWENHSPQARDSHSRLKFSFSVWKFQSRALCFCGQRGPRNEIFILDWNFHSVLKAWFFQYCLSRLNFFNPGALWVFQWKKLWIFHLGAPKILLERLWFGQSNADSCIPGVEK